MIVAGFAAAACSSTSDTGGSADGVGSTPDGPGNLLGFELVPVETASVALGEAFAFDIEIENPGATSVGVDLALDLTAPSGETVSFHETRLFVPFGDVATERVLVTPAQWYSALGDFRVSLRSHGDEVAETLSFEVVDPTVVVPIFEDVTVSAGVETTVPSATCGQFSNGAAWGDVDGDGDLDLFVTRLGDPSQLFLNDGTGAFDESAAARGLAVADANGAAFADYDNDGDADLYLARDGSDLLLRNDGSGRFTDVSDSAGIADPDYRGVTVAWGDFDSDGHLDAYVADYMRCVGEWSTVESIINDVEYHPDLLWHNNGDGTFSEMIALVDNDPDDYYDGYTLGAGFGAAWIDYDDDNRLDLYLANDFVGPVPDHNRLWHNDGPGADGTWSFTDVSLESGTGFFMNTMGIGIGDFDRDLDLDMALSNIGANKLLRNDAGAGFVEEPGAGVARPTQETSVESVTWGLAFYDLNLDGWEDLYIPAGNLIEPDEGPAPVQPNGLYVNDGTGDLFLDVSAATGADDPGESKGAALADYDGDGDIDMFVVNQGGQPRLYRNITPTGSSHWLQIEPVGTVSNRDGCGARVTLTTDTGAMTRLVSCGSTGVASGNQRAVHFGLAAESAILGLEIRWPSGIVQEVDDVEPDRLIVLEEPVA
jgi:hypothetical protein